MIPRSQTIRPDLVRCHSSYPVLRGGLLQRKCACGGTPGPSGECEECRKKRLQRKIGFPSSESRNGSLAPPIVQEALHLPGQPLDQTVRSMMETRFGHDFANVRVHTQDRAAESARAVDALAYTVGPHIVFAAGQYSPNTDPGKQLIAHELTHVVQQRHDQSVDGPLRIGSPNDSYEQEAQGAAALAGVGNAGIRSAAPRLQPTLQRVGPAALGAIAAGGVLAGFGIAFVADYLSMTRARAEEYARNLDTLYPGWLDALPDCPCVAPADDTTNWVVDQNERLQSYHPGAASSYRSTSAATGGSRHGQQCTYDAAGHLITSGAAAGTPDVYSPSWRYPLNVPYHVVYDVKTWDELKWPTYNQYWRPNNGRSCPSNEGRRQTG